MKPQPLGTVWTPRARLRVFVEKDRRLFYHTVAECGATPSAVADQIERLGLNPQDVWVFETVEGETTRQVLATDYR
jgi:precorrin-6B methylase 1